MSSCPLRSPDACFAFCGSICSREPIEGPTRNLSEPGGIRTPDLRESEFRRLAPNVLLGVGEGVLHVVVGGGQALVIRLFHDTLEGHTIPDQLNDPAIAQAHELLGL